MSGCFRFGQIFRFPTCESPTQRDDRFVLEIIISWELICIRYHFAWPHNCCKYSSLMNIPPSLRSAHVFLYLLVSPTLRAAALPQRNYQVHTSSCSLNSKKQGQGLLQLTFWLRIIKTIPRIHILSPPKPLVVMTFQDLPLAAPPDRAVPRSHWQQPVAAAGVEGYETLLPKPRFLGRRSIRFCALEYPIPT